MPDAAGSTIHCENMRILLIRHGVAEDREVWAKAKRAEEDRPLTKAGRRKLRRAAKAIQQIVPEITVVASSPLARAVQTAQIVAKRFPDAPLLQIAHLSPRRQPSGLLNWLQTQPKEATIALIGHEPHLSTFAGWMTTGLQESFVVLKKGGAALLQIGPELKPARAKIEWVLKPGQLRKMAR